MTFDLFNFNFKNITVMSKTPIVTNLAKKRALKLSRFFRVRLQIFIFNECIFDVEIPPRTDASESSNVAE